MEDSKTYMNTLSQILEKLRLKKQDNEFDISEKGFTCGKGKFYQPTDLKIIKTYRFEGDSDPADNSILHVLEANDGLVGYTMDAYGAYSNHINDGYDDFIKEIPVEERAEKEIFE